MKNSVAGIVVLLTSMLVSAQTPAPLATPLTRHYRDGEILTYRMTASNDQWHYTAEASGLTKRTTNGSYVEEFRWTNMKSSGQSVTLQPETTLFRELLSLDPGWMPSGPDLSKVEQQMVGPITDLFTFYTDLWLINKIGALRQPGDHFHLPNPQTGSWADGKHVIMGKDHIDFDLNLQLIDQGKQTALIIVHHVPPAHPNLEFPAAWMEAPVADTPNNWIEVRKIENGDYLAAVGKETFDVSIVISTTDGRILSASMDNPVVTKGRQCHDAKLTQCSDASQHTIRRHVEIVQEQ